MIPGANSTASTPPGGSHPLATGTTPSSMNVLDQPFKDISTLLHFTWGDSSELFICDADDNISVDIDNSGSDETFTSKPGVNVTLPGNTGLFEEEPLKIKLPQDTAQLFTDLSTDAAHAKVELEVFEYATNDTLPFSLRSIYKGFLNVNNVNPKGEAGLIELELLNDKARANVPLGIIATAQCQWVFGKRGCKATVIQNNITVSAIINTRIIHSGVPALTETDGYYIRGYMQYDGLRITVRNWDGVNTFELTRQPPSSWSGQSVTLVGGCNKTIENCRDTQRNREEDFSGLGIGIPLYNPITENS